jgi:hypothetical protein
MNEFIVVAEGMIRVADLEICHSNPVVGQTGVATRRISELQLTVKLFTGIGEQWNKMRSSAFCSKSGA